MEFEGESISRHLSLEVLGQESRVSIASLIENGAIVLKLLRRFGCPYTRFEAQELNRYREKFGRLGVELIAVGFEAEGLESFQEEGYWNGDLYFDTDREVYKFFNLKRLNHIQGLVKLLKSAPKKTAPLTFRGMNGDLHGDGLQMGGTFIINRQGKILYGFSQNNYSDFPDLGEMLMICRKDAEERFSFETGNSLKVETPSIRKMSLPEGVTPDLRVTPRGSVDSGSHRNLPPLFKNNLPHIPPKSPRRSAIKIKFTNPNGNSIHSSRVNSRSVSRCTTESDDSGKTLTRFQSSFYPTALAKIPSLDYTPHHFDTIPYNESSLISMPLPLPPYAKSINLEQRWVFEDPLLHLMNLMDKFNPQLHKYDSNFVTLPNSQPPFMAEF